jgi:hypothetical protein
MDIVIQGGIWPNTSKTAIAYSKLDFVDSVVISTWEGEEVTGELPKNVSVIKSSKPEQYGPGNINLQIVSSLNGVLATTSDWVMKIRSDEFVYEESFNKIYEFFKDNIDQETLTYLDGSKQKSKIFIIGNNKNYPYHPQDHIYWGHRRDIINLLDIPLSTEEPYPGANCPNGYFNDHIRSPMHIGMHYYAKFFEEAKKHCSEFREYLLDASPGRPEAMDFYTLVRDSIFQPLPRIKLHWEKYNSGYWYTYEADGEYYAD